MTKTRGEKKKYDSPKLLRHLQDGVVLALDVLHPLHEHIVVQPQAAQRSLNHHQILGLSISLLLSGLCKVKKLQYGMKKAQIKY
jgi:hypothetical protein